MMPNQTTDRPYTAVFDETEAEYRERPCHGFHFMPVGFNADKLGQLVCFRVTANLLQEATARGADIGAPGESVWADVIWKDRKCPTWAQWVPGVSPREQFAEDRARRFTLDLKHIETRLTRIAIVVSVVIGLLQMSLMTPDSFGWRVARHIAHLVRPQAAPKVTPKALPKSTDGGAEGIPRAR
jgi:hypothetical protein